jgi:rare lipoprotein A
MISIQNSKFKIQNYLLLSTLFFLTACGGPSYHVRVIDTPSQPQLKGTQKPYEVNGERYEPIRSANGFVEEGIASWYGKKFHGRKTSNGETYDMYAMTAAHKTLPMNVHVRVVNQRNGRSTVVRVNDRGPFIRGRIIDLSYTAAKALDVVGPGTAPVRIEALGYKEESPAGQVASYRQPETYRVGQFMVQVGAFTVKENAYRLAAKMKAQYGSSAVAEGWVEGQKFYRVRVGLFTTLDLAETALRQLEGSGFPSSFVIAK